MVLMSRINEGLTGLLGAYGSDNEESGSGTGSQEGMKACSTSSGIFTKYCQVDGDYSTNLSAENAHSNILMATTIMCCKASLSHINLALVLYNHNCLQTVEEQLLYFSEKAMIA